jgi:hypothetical protein
VSSKTLLITVVPAAKNNAMLLEHFLVLLVWVRLIVPLLALRACTMMVQCVARACSYDHVQCVLLLVYFQNTAYRTVHHARHTLGITMT